MIQTAALTSQQHSAKGGVEWSGHGGVVRRGAERGLVVLEVRWGAAERGGARWGAGRDNS